MKRIGILTFHRAHNAGAMLQAFALQKYISSIGDFKAELVDYRNKQIESQYYPDLSVKYYVKYILKYFIYHKDTVLRNKMRKRYNAFLKHNLVVSKKIYDSETISSANDAYDYFITGSDQVWNLQLTDHDLNYFLKFAKPEKRFCYAASFGANRELELSDEKKEISELLGSINTLLLREQSGIDILCNIDSSLEEKAKVVCDPIFFLSKEEWINNLSLEKQDNNPYILLFIVAPDTHSKKVAEQLARKNGYRIKYVNSYGKRGECPENYENNTDVGPKELLELILYAKIVITTSFHGMAFAINFNKELYYELDRRKMARNDRLKQLAKIFDLERREITDSQIPSTIPLDYQMINEKLQIYVSESQKCIMDSLAGD